MRAGSGDLVEAIYAAALDPDGWGGVMSLVRRRFASNAEGLYFLDFDPRSMRVVCQDGFAERWLRCFDEAYFSTDNPWAIHSPVLHRPGVVRTNERLARFTRDPRVLYRSRYYNEWMRPQDFRYTIGNTMLAERRTVANLTLMRPPDAPTFSASDVRAFERMSVHMTRALQVAVRLERAAERQDQAIGAFDALDHAVLMVDARGRLLYANAAAEILLRRRGGLEARDGQLRTVQAREQGRLDALIRAVLPHGAPSGPDGRTFATIGRGAAEAPLTLRAVRVVSDRVRFLAPRAVAMLTVDDPATATEGREATLARAFGATPAEARLAIALAGGASLRQAGEGLGITYGTARGYLKILFRKTESHRQAQLVARVLAACGTALSPPTGG